MKVKELKEILKNYGDDIEVKFNDSSRSVTYDIYLAEDWFNGETDEETLHLIGNKK